MQSFVHISPALNSSFTPVPGLHLPWSQLRAQVSGRLYESVPYAQPCYDDFASSECTDVRNSYLDEAIRSTTPTAFIQTQWEACQTTNEQCLLDWRNPHDDSPIRGSQCKIGSLPSYYIDVQTAGDVKAAFDFSRSTRVPISIRNTGHDYKGRSSAPGSLGLWMHNLQDISYNPEFIPQGCSAAETTPSTAVTMGAGVRWSEAHAFADKNNITLVGGSDKSVGAVGGWLQGGGHGPLSNTMGMGADRVLEFQVVTPDGQLRVANECQNSDLFWALRGGGGGTFGVVLSATVFASPAVTLQSVILSWGSPNADISGQRNQEAWSLFVDGSVALAEEGWGGFVIKDVLVLINPKPSAGESSAILPLVNWAKALQAKNSEVLVVQQVFPSFPAFFNVFTSKFVASVGKNLALSSRLVPTSALATPSSRSDVVEALRHANTVTSAPGVIILMTTPYSVKDDGRKTSVNPKWRESIWHVTSIETWAWNATNEEVQGSYKRAKESLAKLRDLTGGSEGAAYVNEADVYEDEWEKSFWGDNYERLVELKKRYDPDHLLDCWHCVGFQRDSERFGCYPPVLS
ncbi:hypothetical protein NMY22_g8486 [Coprinellus aureogranulatus]|nr:hypothetical protein NMY22_g8486 [Coprinellus aureogranulatus]